MIDLIHHLARWAADVFLCASMASFLFLVWEMSQAPWYDGEM